MVEDSGLPGLLGTISLERLDALIRVRTGEMWFLGAGGVKMDFSPGTRHFQMVKAPSGHWFLPVSKFSDKAKKTNLNLHVDGASSSSDLVPEKGADQQEE